MEEDHIELVEALVRQLSRVEGLLDRFTKQAEEVQRHLAKLTEERIDIRRLLARYDGPPARSEEADEGSGEPFEGALSDAIIETVQNAPGIPAGELYSKVEALGLSEAKSPRHSIGNMARQMARRGRILKEGGRFYPADYEQMEALEAYEGEEKNPRTGC